MLSDTEIQSLRTHLGYGSIDYGASAYSPDGFKELFVNVIAAHLETGPATTGSTAVTAGTVATVSVLSLTGIVPNERLVVDVGDDAEIVVVKATGALTFMARCTKDHAVGGYPVATLSGEARLRLLLNDADRAWQKIQSIDIADAAGIQQLGKGGEIIYFPGNRILRDVQQQYQAIIDQIASLVRVRSRLGNGRNVSVSGY